MQLIGNRKMPFFCIIVAFDAIQGVYSGILQGAGMPVSLITPSDTLASFKRYLLYCTDGDCPHHDCGPLVYWLTYGDFVCIHKSEFRPIGFMVRCVPRIPLVEVIILMKWPTSACVQHIGFGVGLGIACTRLAWLVLKNDWDESARLAQAHIKTSTKRAQELNGDVGL